MAKSKQAAERIAQFKGMLIARRPFYGSILIMLRMVEKVGLRTMGTDGRRLVYDPEWVMGLSDEELVGCLCHEALHVVALHPLRRCSRDMFIWNVATDVEVNHVVVNQEYFKLPEGTVPGRPGLAEEHYRQIMENAEQAQCGGGSGEGEEGSGDHQHGWCALEDPELKEGESWQEFEEEVKGNVRQAATLARMAGKLPAGMERMLEEYLTPKLDAEEILRRFVESVFDERVSWSRPNRRYLHRGVALPGIGRKARVADVALAVDTSGSIGEAELVRACSEVRGIVEGCYPAETVLPMMWFDTEVHLDWIGRDDELRPKGGGGTRFAAVMEAFVEERLEQKGLVVITDGYCSDFGEEPEVPVLWVVFGDAAVFTPPFGEVIELEVGE